MGRFHCSSGTVSECDVDCCPAKISAADTKIRAIFLNEIIFTYFFLYPVGQIGLIAVTFLEVLPFVQVIVVFFIGATALEGVAGVTTGWVSTFGTTTGVATGAS